MKKLFLYVALAMAFFVSMPTMAGGVPGYSTTQSNLDLTEAYTVTDVMSVKASGIAIDKPASIQAGALFVPVIAYEKPRIHAKYDKRVSKCGFNKLNATVLITAYLGRYQHAGVTTA